ncbi:prolipoprotein diacylglyceryl transferase [Jatrophihabitans endophyticus]|uniref:prolipoprotein diacylglyceryl transferase n=1 Tax=Jatrophihabitans endophyticus TaxID=1206085 RepID=UPI0026EAF6DC|nr:prolipoprotein diacylglyceryl transferase [Jatrophihabitans endophyticus]
MPALADLPSPTRAVLQLGPLPIRAYALCIIVGILVAVWLANRRWVARGGESDHVWDIAGWAIVFGIIGGRLYHLITDPELYFLGRPGTSPWNAFKIWDGGLGIWGAIALGTLGAYIGCRRRGVDLRVFADCAAPGVLYAQGIGRLGNWFNNELYGDPTTMPWGLRIHCLDASRTHEIVNGIASGGEQCPLHSATLAAAYQPTFLYELIWDVAIATLVIYLDRRLRLGRGNVMALYVMGYTAGRGWIEALRSDHANHILGLRVNDWVSMIVFLLALVYFVRHGGFRAEREASPYYAKREPDPEPVPADD